MTDSDFDVVIAGGGLAGTLAAYRLRQLHPTMRILLLEGGARLGGDHTWSFHDTDLPAGDREWMSPFIAHRWPQQQVRFPKIARMLSSGYNTIFSDSLHYAAMELLDGSVRFNVRVEELEAHRAILAGGDVMRAACVIDARGLGTIAGLKVAYQKFAGLEVRFEAPHGQPYPIIMDATVPQRDGYRFVYTLPYTDDRMLIEDTYYSDGPGLDVPALQRLCHTYARARGWVISRVLRAEEGVLPVVLAGSLEAILAGKTPGVATIGLRGGFFHHTTSYSLSFAVQCAGHIAASNPLTSEALDSSLRDLAHRHWQGQSFFRLLNRMLFWAAKPSQRYRVLERFYEMGDPLIERFYNSSLTSADKARLLIGWPPVPLHRAVRVLSGKWSGPLPRMA
jgi:lycopene beta-cyclase